jgi:hypothetical protein
MPLPLVAGLSIAVPLGTVLLCWGLHRMRAARSRAIKQLQAQGELLPGKRKSSQAATASFKRQRTGARNFAPAAKRLSLEAPSARRSGAAGSGSGVGRASAAGRTDVWMAAKSARESMAKPARVRAYESLRSMSRRLTGRR